MKRRLLKVVEHDPDTNQDEIEFRKILQEFHKKNRDDVHGVAENVEDMMEKFGLRDGKVMSPKYQAVYTKIKYALFVLFGFVLSLIYQSTYYLMMIPLIASSIPCSSSPSLHFFSE